jgi:dihydroneopterin aldolase
MAQVILRKLQVEAAVGLLDWERAQTQVLDVTCHVQIDASRAAASDSIEDTLDYAALREAIHAYCREHRFYLLEALADGLADHLLSAFAVAEAVRLRLIKPAIFPDADGAGVEIEKLHCY